MDKILIEIIEERKSQLTLKGNFAKQLSLLPKGCLSVNTKNNVPYYTKLLEGQRVYLGKGDNPAVVMLQRRHFLEEGVRRINKNIELFNKIKETYLPISPLAILESAPQAYNSLSKLNLVYRKNTFEEAWENENYNKSQKHPENLVHLTIKGDYVRSKSEVLIANDLVSNSVAYHYEEELTINGVTVTPDFTILARRRKKIIWEHFGMISNPDYLKKCMWKIGFYIENGYRLWDNLIITFDDMDGAINTQIIEQIINTFIKHK